MVRRSWLGPMMVLTALVAVTGERRTAFAAEEPGQPATAAAAASTAPAGADDAVELPVEAQLDRAAGAEKTTRTVMVLPAVRAALSRSTTGLREQPLPGPAGGIGIDLQGRFQSAVVATRGIDGRLALMCTAGEPSLEETP